MSRSFIILLLMLTCGWSHAQGDTTSPERIFIPYAGSVPRMVDTPLVAPIEAHGQVVFTTDKGVEELMEQYASAKDELKGYRVQIFLGTREQANPLRAAFLQKNPDVPAYLSYLAPNFRVRVGDLRDRREAERLRLSLKDTYPGAYIVQDDIELPRLPE